MEAEWKDGCMILVTWTIENSDGTPYDTKTYYNEQEPVEIVKMHKSKWDHDLQVRKGYYRLWCSEIVYGGKNEKV